MVGFMSGYHLIPAHSLQDSVHNRPLWGSGLPASLGFGLRKRYNSASSQIGVKRIVLDENAAPDDLAWLADACQGSTAHGEIDCRLAIAAGASVSADIMRCG